MRSFAVETRLQPVLSGGERGKHKIQGIGAGFVPDNFDRSVVDEVVKVSDDEAFEMARRIAKEEGITCGISCGAECPERSRWPSAPKTRQDSWS